MYIIKNEYINKRGQKFDNLRNINFPTFGDLSDNFGTFITETTYEGNFFGSDFRLENGVYLYRTNYDYNKALRIYKDFANYKYLTYGDDRLVSYLLSVQKDVKLTQFPTGIVTIEDKVVGQEIVYYDNHSTLKNKFEEKDRKKTPKQYYIEILEILKELCKVGVVYSDLHPKNFVVNNVDGTIKLIDFDINFIKINYFDEKEYSSMIYNLKKLLKYLNEYCKLEFSSDYDKANSLSEIEECIYNLKKK